MYGKQKSEVDRVQMKQQKRDQLQSLIVNKFRNKYSVNGVEEIQIDKLIKEEVHALLAQGSTYEANLQKVDKKLEGLIAQMRAGKSVPSKMVTST